MNRVRLAAAAVIIAALTTILVACGTGTGSTGTSDGGPAVVVEDPDRCVPPPSGDGPWVEQDDGEECVLDPWTESWVEEDDADTFHRPRTQQVRRSPQPTARATAPRKQAGPVVKDRTPRSAPTRAASTRARSTRR